MSKIKLLIIDDEEEITETLSEVFEDEGYIVGTAGTGAEAYEKAAETQYDVALVDMNLPDAHGEEILRELKKGNPDIVCIIITGFASLDSTLEAFKDGASGYFTKPLKINEVVHGVKEATEKQLLTRELKKSEERYRGLVQDTMDAIIGLDSFANVVSWNKGAEEMLGYTADEMSGKSMLDLIPEELRESYQQNIEEAKKEGFVMKVETTRITKDGRVIPAEMTLTALVDENENLIGFTSILRDITERKEEEDKIRKYAGDLEEKLQRIELEGVSRFDSLIKRKNSYFLKEKRYEKSTAIFSNLIKFGLKGLCLTTKHPDVLTEMYPLEGFKPEFIWLSSSGGGEASINPSDLTALHSKITEFTKKNENSIVLFLGLEYIITLGGFEKSLRFLNSVIDTITIYNSRLMVSVDPETLGTRELSLLENALIETKDEDLIRLGLE